MLCCENGSMTVSITIRDVPNDVRDELASRAARSGRSVQEYLSAELREMAAKPQIDVVLAEIRARTKRYPAVSTQEILDAIAADRK
jgi:plasmid stability protein